MSGATRREIVEEFIPHSPFTARLGIRIVRIGDDRAELTMPFEPGLATIGDLVHGGAIASLLDTAGMVAAWANDDVPERISGSTAGLTVDLVAPASGSDLTALARVIRRGRRLCFVEVDVTDAEGATVAKGLVTYSYG
jgi:uncharacterized protein (TIGR00369 family)